jgi:hypothetical protein
MQELTFNEADWTRRNVAEEPRLTELVDLYTELGFEVYLKEVGKDECPSDDCTTCLMASPDKYKVIFTR